MDRLNKGGDAIAEYAATRRDLKVLRDEMHRQIELELEERFPGLLVICKKGRTGAVRMEMYSRAKLAQNDVSNHWIG